MRACSQCGTPNDDARPACAVCGAALPAAPDPRTRVPVAQQTMLGMPAMAPSVSGGDLGRTLVGTADPASMGTAPATLASPGGPSLSGQRTMLGISPMQAPSTSAPGGAPPSTMKTMLGMAPLSAPATGSPQPFTGSATLPSHGAPATPSAVAGVPQAPASVAPGSQAAPPPSATMPSNMKTVLGVAMPGIAPLNPGVAKAPAPAAGPPPRQAAPPPGPLPPTTEDLAVLPGHARGRVPWLALAAIAIAGLLAAGAVGVAILWRAPKPLQASVVVGADGLEALEITCEGCADGVTIAAGTRRAVVRDRKATLTLEKALTVGDNEIPLTIERGGGKTENASLVVPVDYRVRADVTALNADPPKIRIAVEATKGIAVAVDGRPVALDTAGRGAHEMDVSAPLTGPSADAARLERKVPYTVTPTEGPPATGEVSVGIPIVPLRVDAPGAQIVVETPNFMLAGRTQKGGAVTVAGSPITVDPSGRFAQLMNVSSEGETTITVRATLADHAPRLVPIRVKRVKSLVEEAAAFRKKATDAYAAVATDIDSKQGWAVALTGRVLEARAEDHSTVILLDVPQGCTDAPCVARLVHGARLAVAKGDGLTAFGRITRPVDGLAAGKKVPEIAVDFVLRGERR